MSTERVAPAFAPPYALPTFASPRARELDGDTRRHAVAIAGGGLAGLTLACDLARRGIDAVLLDDDDTVGVRGASSRGICYAQKSLETFDRLGIYARIAAKGVTWSVGRTYADDAEVYRFDLETDRVSVQPPFVNLQQFYLEWFLVDRIVELGHVELRWKHRVGRVDLADDHARVEVSSPDGDYVLACHWLVDATGANSPLRNALGLDTHASRSADRWCISDVRFAKPLPLERWTWIAAPFNEGRAVWQHLMGDAVWRMDYQMAPDCDVDAISQPEVAAARLRAQLGDDVAFEFVWIGPYQYRDHLLDTFRTGRLFFVGDTAHVVSPFGARGGNSGIQDANNLGWKLAMVVRGDAPATLLDSYDAERRPAAVENLAVTRRTARFIAPRGAFEHRLRQAVLALARGHPFARALVNTGRMSRPNAYPSSRWLPRGARDVQNLPIAWRDGAPGTLASLLAERTAFVAVWFAPGAARAAACAASDALVVVAVGGDTALRTFDDGGGAWAAHLGADAGDAALIRPDGYLATVVRDADAASIVAAFGIAIGRVTSASAPSSSRRPACPCSAPAPT